MSSEFKQRTFITLIYFMAFVGLGLVSSVLGTTLPYLAELTETGFSQISLLFIARSAGYLFGSVLSGHLYDRVCGHPLMALSLIGLAGSLILTPYVSLLWLLVGVLFITGISQGFVDVGGNTLIVWVHGKNVGPYMNALHLFYGVGTFLAPIIIAQAVLISGNFSWGYLIIAVLVFTPVLPLFLFPSQPAPSNQAGEHIASTNQQLVFLAAFFLFCYSSMANIFGGWIFSYVVKLGLTTEANAAYLTSTFWGVFTVGRLLSIPIALRFKPGSILLGDLIGCLLSITIILLSPYSIFSIWIGAAGLGLSAASLFPATISLVGQRINITGKITSHFVIGGALGAMFPPWIVGQLFETTDPKMMLYSVLLSLLVGLLVYVFLMRAGKTELVEFSA